MDWNSSALWGIIGLIGGIIVSFIFYILSQKKKKLTFAKFSQVLITDNISEIDGLAITFSNKQIKNLISTTIKFESTGKDIIEMKDFATSSPLTIKTTGEFLLQDDITSILTNNSNPNNSLIPIKINNSEIKLQFDYISPNDTIFFTILHTEQLSVEGILKTGSLIDNTVEIKKGFSNGFKIRLVISIILSILFVSINWGIKAIIFLLVEFICRTIIHLVIFTLISIYIKSRPHLEEVKM